MSLAVRTAEKGEAACFDAVLRFGLGEVVATVGNACSSKETSCILVSDIDFLPSSFRLYSSAGL